MKRCTIAGCDRTYVAKGMCRRHYDRMWRTGTTDVVPRVRPSLEERLWPRVDKRADGCWLWTGALNAAGYGAIGGGKKVLRVHRVAYELLVGPIPPGLQLDHLCRNRACCNPAHLEPVTNRENWIRGENKTAVVVRTGKCARGLHDMANAVTRPNGTRYCRECAYAANRSRRAS